MRPVSPALPAGDQIDSPRLVLRDGTVASVRPSVPADREAIRGFFAGLSAESRRQRFFSASGPSDQLIEQLADATDPTSGLTLVVERQVDEGLRPIAVASYLATSRTTAEAAFAVDDRFQGRGVATALLERLAVHASRHGFEKFRATTLADNVRMLEVFYDSGFEIRSKAAAGVVELQLSLAPSSEGVRSAEERDRLATSASLTPLLSPRGVAVIGVSREPHGIGRRVLTALMDARFSGSIYPVNPHLDEIDGLKVFHSARDLPPETDLAVIAVPAAGVLGVAEDCMHAGVRSLVVISAGFAEAGEAGRLLQTALVERVRGYGMRMVGPNCMGLLNANPEMRLNASFSPVMAPSGRVALLSQSGALGIAILALAKRRGVGLSTFVSVGNKADVSGNDLLQYWSGDPDTSVVLMYLESLGNPRRFARIARRLGRTKPIVVVKAGRTREGSRAAGSHTAALAGSDVAASALFEQTGVIRADTIDELFDVAACLEAQPLPAGRRVAIVTNAGGPGILAADACAAAGLDVVAFGAATLERFRAFLPPAASIANPVDMVASAGPAEYQQAVEVALASSDVDALIVIFTPVEPGTAAATLDAVREGIAAGRRSGGSGKTVLACVMAESDAVKPLDIPASSERVPAYAFPENAARTLGKVATYAAWRRQPPALFWTFDDIRPADARQICQAVSETRGDAWLTPEEVSRVLHDFGLPLLPTVVARTPDDAAALAGVFGFPVVAKLQSARVLHKTDVGGVHVGLSSDRAVRSAFRELTALAAERGGLQGSEGEGVVIQPMVSGGVETMIGITDDPVFGPLMAFGLGGIHVEVLQDVRFRVAPLSDRDADDLLHGVRGFKLLEGFRGHPPADIDALREILLRVARLAEEIPEIAELDLNPVIALPPGQGCRIADARVRVAAKQGTRGAK